MKRFFISLCLVLVAYGCAGFIKNSGKTAKMTRLVFALSVLCSLISILPTISLDFPSFNSVNEAEYTNTELSEEVFKETVARLLQSENITYSKIQIISSKNEDKSINIDKIKISGASDPNKAREVLEQNIKIERIEVS